MKIFNKRLKTGLILLGIIAVISLIMWGIYDGWIAILAALALIFIVGRGLWGAADEIRKTFFNND